MPHTAPKSGPQFDYELLGMHGTAVKQAAFELRIKVSAAVAMLIEAGQELVRIKRLIGRGYFQEWVAAEFLCSGRTVERWMQLALLAGESDTVSNLPLSTLYKLTAKATPSEVRDTILNRMKIGELVDEEQVLDELQRLTRSSLIPPHPAAISTVEGAISEEPNIGGPPADYEEDEDEKWERQVKEVAAALARGLGSRAEDFTEIVSRIDGGELCFHFQRHLLSLRTARKGVSHRVRRPQDSGSRT